jgi:hypothetical protein
VSLCVRPWGLRPGDRREPGRLPLRGGFRRAARSAGLDPVQANSATSRPMGVPCAQWANADMLMRALTAVDDA